MIILTKARKLCQWSTCSNRVLKREVGGGGQKRGGNVTCYHLSMSNEAIKKAKIFTLMSDKVPPCLIFSQCDSDAADSVAGLHVSVLNGLSQLILQAQHLRDQFQ